MTQEIYQKAIKFAGEKHKNDTVPGTNSNYLLHVSNVAMEILMAYAETKNFDIDFALQLALLHDTIEDTDADFNEIKNEFNQRVAIGVQALTKNDEISSKEERMIDSLNRINTLEKEVGMVKLADRITNLQVPPNTWDKDKIRFYHKEAQVLELMLQNKNTYLNNRLKQKIEDYKKYTF